MQDHAPDGQPDAPICAPLLVTLCVGLSNLFWLPVMGAVSVSVGRQPLLILFILLILVSVYPALSWLVAQPSFRRLLGVEVWFSCLYGSYNGAMIVALTEIVPVQLRTAGFSVAYSLATALFGGFTPAISTFLIGGIAAANINRQHLHTRLRLLRDVLPEYVCGRRHSHYAGQSAMQSELHDIAARLQTAVLMIDLPRGKYLGKRLGDPPANGKAIELWVGARLVVRFPSNEGPPQLAASFVSGCPNNGRSWHH